MNAPNPRVRNPSWRTPPVAITSRAIEVESFRVEVVSGPDRGHTAIARGAELGIGTAPGNELVVADPAASRHHAVIEATSSGFQLRDLGSTCGTWLAGHRIHTAYVEPGALIQIGETTLRFDALEERASEPLSDTDTFGDVLGQSAAMRRIFGALERLADADTAILFDGESGTGKGALAAATHQQGGRRSGRFVVVDCGSFSADRLESELFGHERGAFAGADERRAGAFEAADGGTLFLDEIGDLPLELQPKLLRVLEGRQVRRIGSVAPIPVSVRVIAASNRDLRHEVNAGQFHPELYDRLRLVRLTVPALRDRREDIPLLAAHFYRLLSGGDTPPAELLARLLGQPLHGNLRELRRAVERAVQRGRARAPEGGAPAAGHTWPAMDFTISFRACKEVAIAAWTRIYARELVERYGGNLSRAARAVSMDRNHLRDLLNRYAADEDESAGAGDGAVEATGSAPAGL